MMHLQWHAVNGTILDIREPDTDVPDPVYVYLTSSGFGSASCRFHDGTDAMSAVQPGSVFWQLQPGENIVTFSTPSGSVEVAIEYVSRYTGV